VKINVVSRKSDSRMFLEVRPETGAEVLLLIKLTNKSVLNKALTDSVLRSKPSNVIKNLVLYIPLKGNKNDKNSISQQKRENRIKIQTTT